MNIVKLGKSRGMISIVTGWIPDLVKEAELEVESSKTTEIAFIVRVNGCSLRQQRR